MARLQTGYYYILLIELSVCEVQLLLHDLASGSDTKLVLKEEFTSKTQKHVLQSSVVMCGGGAKTESFYSGLPMTGPVFLLEYTFFNLF